MSRIAFVVGAVLIVAGATVPVNGAQDDPAATGTQNLSGLHDFDFLVGEWRVHSRRLRASVKCAPLEEALNRRAATRRL